jgi:hypothetical protein
MMTPTTITAPSTRITRWTSRSAPNRTAAYARPMPRLSHRPRFSEKMIGTTESPRVILSTRPQVWPGFAASAARAIGVSIAQVDPQAFV